MSRITVILLGLLVLASFMFSPVVISAKTTSVTGINNDYKCEIDNKIIDIIKNNKTSEEALAKKLTDINTSLDKYAERIDSAKRIADVQLVVITAIASIVIALVAICLGLGVYKIYIDHKRLVEDAEKLTRETFDKWKNEREAAMNTECENIVKSMQGNLQYFAYFLMLRELVAKGNMHSDEVYPLLTPLVEKPSRMYKPIFNKIIELNINDEITRKAKEGVSKIK